jgi:hypothetical protein
MEDFMIHLLLIAVLSLAGCYSSSSGSAGIKNQDLVGQIKIGKSTKNDVTLLFGQPNSVTRSSFQVANQGDPKQMVTVVESWGYQHTHAQTDGRSFIPFAGLWLGGTNYETAQVEFGFDGKGIVQQVTSAQQKGRAGAFGNRVRISHEEVVARNLSTKTPRVRLYRART